jgi:hypothetical protein
MSKILQITQAKPNPVGKDKAGNYPKPEQLLAEWVDIKNVGTEAVAFSSISLSHTLFNDQCQNTGRTDVYWTWASSTDSLLPNQMIRVRTGRFRDKHLISPSDDTGNNWNGFANRDNFVLNNRCGDILTVTWTGDFGSRKSDTVSYDRNQPEGAILRRSGNKLVLVSGYGR